MVASTGGWPSLSKFFARGGAVSVVIPSEPCQPSAKNADGWGTLTNPAGQPASAINGRLPRYCHVDIVDVSDPFRRKPLLLLASILAAQSKCVHFLISGSDSVTRTPIDGAVHDGWPIDY